jgi:hypothetical protein
MIDSIIPIGLILLYLLTTFLINYYRNISPRKKKAQQIKLEDIEPALALYCYNNGNASKLFWVTLLDLIDRDYYKLYSEDNISYIKWNKKDILKVDELNLKEFEIKLVTYINTLIYKNNEKNYISLEQLQRLVSSDWSYQSISNSFTVELKKEAIKTYGIVDKISIFEEPAILTYIYAMQVLYFFDVNFSTSQILLLSIPLTIITLIISNLLKHTMIKYTLKRHIFIVIPSIIMSVIAFYIWNSLSSIDYIIFHIAMALFAFMYPLLVITNIYFMKTTSHYLNKLQQDIIDQLDDLKIKTINNEIEDINYTYVYGLKMKIASKNKEYNDFLNVFKI